MIVIEGGPLFQAQIVAVPVIAIVFEHGDLVVADAFDDASDDRRLPRAGTARDADDERRPARLSITCVLRLHHALTASVRLAKRRQPSAACSMRSAGSSSTCSTVPVRRARCPMRSRWS